MKIAFLDSGIGGLTVLEKFFEENPEEPNLQIAEEMIYFADLANLPYGGKTEQELRKILVNNLSWLQGKADLIVLACNTSSSILDEAIIGQFPNIQILGLIQSFVQDFAERHSNINSLVVFSTLATHRAGTYEKLLKQIRPDLLFQSIPCPEWVPLIEDNLSLSCNELQEVARESIKKSIASFDFEPDAIVFGCTHYPLLKKGIQKHLPPVTLLDPADSIKIKLKNLTFSLLETKVKAYSSGNKEVLRDKLKSLDNILTCAKYCQNKVEAAEVVAAKA